MSKKSYKPTALRALEGGRSHSLDKPEEAAEKEPKPLAVAPPRPDWLDKVGRETWDKLSPILVRLNLLTEIDGDMFGNVCLIRSRLIVCAKALQAKGASFTFEKVNVDGAGIEHVEEKPNPYTMIERQYLTLFQKYAKEFGMSPVGRTGIKIGPGDNEEGDNLLT